MYIFRPWKEKLKFASLFWKKLKSWVKGCKPSQLSEMRRKHILRRRWRFFRNDGKNFIWKSTTTRNGKKESGGSHLRWRSLVYLNGDFYKDFLFYSSFLHLIIFEIVAVTVILLTSQSSFWRHSHHFDVTVIIFATFKVPLTSVEILQICNLWILLRKIVIFLVGRKFHLHRLFCC